MGVEGDAFFNVDARADWSTNRVELTVVDAPHVNAVYRVAGFIAHQFAEGQTAENRLRGGHYIAFVCCQGQWYELNDSSVVALPAPPQHFPYIVFLNRELRRRLSAKRVDPNACEVAMGALLGKRAVRERDGETDDGGSSKKKARVVGRDRSGRDQTGRHQTRDQTGRDQDRSGRLKVEDDPRLQRAWGTTGHGDNRDNSRSDVLNSLDDPYQRYITSWSQRRSAVVSIVAITCCAPSSLKSRIVLHLQAARPVLILSCPISSCLMPSGLMPSGPILSRPVSSNDSGFLFQTSAIICFAIPFSDGSFAQEGAHCHLACIGVHPLHAQSSSQLTI